MASGSALTSTGAMASMDSVEAKDAIRPKIPTTTPVHPSNLGEMREPLSKQTYTVNTVRIWRAFKRRAQPDRHVLR